MPERIQRKRIAGWKKPENTVNVTRPSKWGNPFIIGETPFCNDAETATHMYRSFIELQISYLGDKPPTVEEIKSELKGKNLMCFCSLNSACHANVLLEIANS